MSVKSYFYIQTDDAVDFSRSIKTLFPSFIMCVETRTKDQSFETKLHFYRRCGQPACELHERKFDISGSLGITRV